MISLLKKLGDYVKRHQMRYLICLGLLMVTGIASLVPVQIMRWLVDRLVNQNLTQSQLLSWIFFALIAAIMAYAAESGVDYCFFYGEYDIGKELRDQLFRHYTSRGALFYKRLPIGDLLTRANTDVSTMEMVVGYGVMVMMNSTIQIIFILGVMVFTISAWLSLVSILPIIGLGIFMYFWSGQIDTFFTRKQEALSELNKKLLEIIDGVRVIRAFGVEERSEQIFSHLTNELRQKENKVSQIAVRFEAAFPISLAACYVIAFIGGVHLMRSGELSVGAMMAFMVYLPMVMWPIASLGDLIATLQQGKASWQRIEASLLTEDQLETFLGRAVDHFDNLVLDNYSFRYEQEDEAILKSVHLTIKAGDKIGIVGKTGAGKTTLVRSLLARYPFWDQEPLVNGQPMSVYSRDSLRRLFAYVPQEQSIFSRSIRENLTLGQEGVTEAQVEKVLKMADLSKDIKRMPDGLATLVGEKGVTLSGGQKQRLAMARAFLRDAPILILDDALSAVDASTERHILRAIREVGSAKTLVIISHRLSAVRDCDQIIVLDQGQVVERGRHEDLMALGGWYAMQFEKQMLEEVQDGENNSTLA